MELSQQDIVDRIDALECDAFNMYRRAANLRLVLQRKWRVLPRGEKWTEAAQKLHEANAK